MLNTLKHFPGNEVGRDFIVGDIHGCFRQLEQALATHCFATARDRLFCVGDLVDRGADSGEVLDWLRAPWFHAVRGNHEQMAIDVLAGRYDAGRHGRNGGSWFLALPPSRQRTIVDAFSALPIALEIASSQGLIGLVHADLGAPDWSTLREALRRPPGDSRRTLLIRDALWSRRRVQEHDLSGVPDLYALIVGHTPMRDVTCLGNVFYIDTGAAYVDGRLSVLRLDQLSPEFAPQARLRSAAHSRSNRAAGFTGLATK